MQSRPQARERLREQLGEAEWKLLRPHCMRDVLILVSPELDILEVGVAVVLDETVRVRTWMNEGKLAKPTARQVSLWDEQPDKTFLGLVARPWVLVQEIIARA